MKDELESLEFLFEFTEYLMDVFHDMPADVYDMLDNDLLDEYYELVEFVFGE